MNLSDLYVTLAFKYEVSKQRIIDIVKNRRSDNLSEDQAYVDEEYEDDDDEDNEKEEVGAGSDSNIEETVDGSESETKGEDGSIGEEHKLKMEKMEINFTDSRGIDSKTLNDDDSDGIEYVRGASPASAITMSSGPVERTGSMNGSNSEIGFGSSCGGTDFMEIASQGTSGSVVAASIIGTEQVRNEFGEHFTLAANHRTYRLVHWESPVACWLCQ